MHDRFQVAIDRAAAVAGLTKTDDYVNEWRRVATGVDGDAIAAAHAAAQRLDNDHPRDVLEALVANGVPAVRAGRPASVSASARPRTAVALAVRPRIERGALPLHHVRKADSSS